MPLPLDAKPSDESGGRRQDAANDHGSSEIPQCTICGLLYEREREVDMDGDVCSWTAQCDCELNAVSARSADAEGVLEQVIAYVEAWADQKRSDAKDMKARHFTQAATNTLRDAKMLGRMALAIREKFQNQS